MFLVTQRMLRIKDSSAEHFPFLYVCVDRHSRSSADQQFRAQGSARRTYYCCTFSIVHYRNIFMLCSIRSAVLCIQNNFQIFLQKKYTIFNCYCERNELQICRVHQLGLECIKNGALFVRCWICPATKKCRREPGRDGNILGDT